MAKKEARPYQNFRPESYQLVLKQRKVGQAPTRHLLITGEKVGKPSHRLTRHQMGLEITGAKITKSEKKRTIEYDVIRINHLPSFEQLRLHTKAVMYPGYYQITIDYKLQETAKALDEIVERPNRSLLPSVDEPEAWASAIFETK